MISVVIPLYNKEKSITTTLQSVIDQTYTDWELIVVNDGSTDNSLAVVKNFVAKLPITNHKFQILEQPNGGVSVARNTGLLVAQGEYIAFLDGDDIWEPTYLEEAAQLIHDYPNGAIYGLGMGKMIDGKRYPASEFVPTGFRGVVTNL